MDPALGVRYLNEGFSGGEKKAGRNPADGHAQAGDCHYG
jgi:hypothetical protein